MDKHILPVLIRVFVLTSFCCSQVTNFINADLPGSFCPVLKSESSKPSCSFYRNSKNETVSVFGRTDGCNITIFTEKPTFLAIRKVDFIDSANFLIAAEYSEGADTRYIALMKNDVPCVLVLTTYHVELMIKGIFQVELFNNLNQYSPIVPFHSCISVDKIHECQKGKSSGKVICNPGCDSCQCTLGSHLVTCEKLMTGMITKTSETYLIFQSNMTHLVISANISMVKEDAFVGLNTLKILNLSNNAITVLERSIFDNLISLQELMLNNNCITVLGRSIFDGLIKLHKISISGNKLQTLPSGLFRELQSLSFFDVSENNLPSLSFELLEGVDGLKILNLSNNKLLTLEDKPFRDLVQLQIFLLDNNRLTKLENGVFDGLIELQKLSISGNELRILSSGLFRDLQSLSFLDISGNNLSLLSFDMFEGANGLITLHISNNKLSNLQDKPFRNLVELQELFLNNNYLIITTASDYYGLSSLQTLSIANNQLTQLPDDVFEHLENLSWLDLSNNNLVTLSYKIFERLKNMSTLYLAKNKLMSLDLEVFYNLTNLSDLSLQGNRLKTLIPGTFQHMPLLFSLTLDDNLLKHIQPGLFKDLHYLFLLSIKANKIKTIQSNAFCGLQFLNTLILDNNPINDVEEHAFKGLYLLTHLFLSNNRLTSIAKHVFKDVENLTYLNLKNNLISEIEQGTLSCVKSSLKKLLLQQNQIQQLPSDISQLQHLHSFNVSHNYLETLPPMGKLHRLRSLDLRFNSLIHIKKGTFKGLTNQTEVYVDHEAICLYEESLNTNSCLATESVLPFFTGEPLLWSTSLSVFTWILGFGSLFGNTFVVVWRCLRQGDEDAVQSLLITNLALSDLLMGMYLIIIASADAYFGAEFPLHSHKWVFAGGCDFAGILSVSSSEASVFFVTLISIDRYIRVVHPHTKYRLRIRSTYFSSLVIWFVSLVVSIIPLVLKKTKDDFYDMSEVCIGLPLVKNPVLVTKSLHIFDSEVPCESNSTDDCSIIFLRKSERSVVEDLEVMVFSSTVFLGINLVCFIAVLYCYSAILHIVCKMSKKMKRSGGREREIRMAAKMAVIVLTDCFCWMPIILMGVLVQAGVIELSPVTIAWTVTFILPVNSSVNPYLYSIVAVLAKQIKETKDRRSFKLRSTNMACQTDDTNETAISLCNLVGIGVKKKSIKCPNATECSEAAKMVSI